MSSENEEREDGKREDESSEVDYGPRRMRTKVRCMTDLPPCQSLARLLIGCRKHKDHLMV